MNTLNEIISFYEEGNSISAISRKFKISTYLAKKELVKAGVKIRSRSEQLVLENLRRTKKINHFYFDSLNFENTYYMGFFAADGTIRKKSNEMKIALSSVDKEFLENFKKAIDTEHDIKEYTTNNGFNCVSLVFSSLKIKQDLSKYGIIPNKTFTNTISLKNIPENLRLAFIKGFFDGDGSFSFNENTKQCFLKILCHSRKLLEEFTEVLGEKFSILERKDGNYSLEYSTLPSLRIMQKFYEIDSPYLKRKKEKYLRALDIRK